MVDGATSRRLRLPRNGSLLVGRGDEADVRIESQAVSRRHAELHVSDGEARVADLGSHNGTLLNGERIDGARPLQNGDMIGIGDAELIYRRAADTSRPRRLLDPAALTRRIVEELERVGATERPLGLVALPLGARALADGAGLAAAIDGCLRRLDAAGWSAEGTLVAILPERDRDASEEIARALVAALAASGIARAARAGFATAPADGCDAPTLLGAARAAAQGAAPGEAVDATRAATEIQLGDRRVVLADPAMVRLYDLIKRLAASDLPVLVCGETGAGKEHAAFAVHWHSPRRDGPFVILNCAAITETLVESELFGHEKGAFSGAIAAKPGLIEVSGGGTLFLDEVGELSAAVQAKLLRVLEQKRLTRVGGLREVPVDLRVVAATNRDLEAEVAAGRFRRDLFFRLGAATVVLPPLRDRPREIALLARRFLDDACARLGRPQMAISTGAMVHLAGFAWPGNVRELKNVIEYIAAAIPEPVLEPWCLPDAIVPIAADTALGTPSSPSPGAGATAPARRPGRPLTDEVRDFERQLIVAALAACGEVRKSAAEQLGLPLRTLVYKLKQHGITGRGGG
ncbi:MAG: FHA domain-containing protein [Myxococcales bacterium]|nr:FHA domain-containing protein [Myxococcales bacterium]